MSKADLRAIYPYRLALSRRFAIGAPFATIRTPPRGFPVEEAPIVANFFVIRFQDRCLHGRSEEKNLALEAQHAPQPPCAEGHDVSGMPELR